MRIIRASVTGFMGIDRADVRLGHVNIFFGPNGVGKSSMLEAILLPIFGESPRQSKKKDWCHMIRHPAKKAELFVQYTEEADGQIITCDAAGNIAPKSNSIRANHKPDLFDRVLLNPLAFFDLPPKLKADLAGDVKLDASVVRARLQERGLEGHVLDETVSIIMEHRLAGAEKVLADKRLNASRAISDPGPAPRLFYNGDEYEQEVTQEQLQEYRNNVARWAQAVGAVEERMRQASSIPAERARRQQLRNEAQVILNEVNAPDAFPRQTELDLATKQYNECLATADELAHKLNFDKVKCETCGQMWSPNAPELARRLDDTHATQRELHQSLSELREEFNDWKARKDRQKWAEERIAMLDQLPPLPEVDVETAKADLEANRAGQRQCEEWLQVVERFMTERELWKRRTQEFERAKAIRSIWDLAVNIIRDPQFKASLVADPLEKARKRLEDTGGLLGLKIYIDDQLDVRVNGRPWWLLSTAQKLQASASLADAFAYAGGNKILVIDGVDTLVGSFQRNLVQFLRAIKDDYDTVLLALALEDEKPVAFEMLEAEQREAGENYRPLAHWFWVHKDRDGVTATFRREL